MNTKEIIIAVTIGIVLGVFFASMIDEFSYREDHFKLLKCLDAYDRGSVSNPRDCVDAVMGNLN